MTIVVESVINPAYVNELGNAITCTVKFSTLPAPIPFTATSYDTQSYGVQIYNDCVAGVYGPVTPFNTAKFVTTKQTVGDFDVYCVHADEAGAVIKYNNDDAMERAESTRVSMVTSGSRQYKFLSEQYPPTVLYVGDYNLDLPDIAAGDVVEITSLQPNTTYYCISRKDMLIYAYERLTVSAGNTHYIPAGKHVFIGGGVTDRGAAPLIIAAESQPYTLNVTADVFGLVFS